MRILKLALALVAVGSTLPAQDLKSKDPLERVQAVRALATSGDPKAEAKLFGALKDDDWEVVEAALVALGEIGGEKANGKLVKGLLDLPLWRLRDAGARAAAALDAEATYAAMAKKVAKEPLLACEILNATAAEMDGKVELKAFKRALKSKEPEVRAAAAGTVTRLAGDERVARVGEFLESTDLLTKTATLDALIDRPDPELIETLLGFAKSNASLADVVERRLAEALRACVHVDEKAALEHAEAFSPLANEELHVDVRATLVRALGVIVEARPGTESSGSVWRDDASVLGLLEAKDDSWIVRRAQAGVLGLLGSDAALESVKSRIADEGNGGVRRVLLESLLVLSDVQDEETRQVVLGLAKDGDATVRERAVVALGVRDLEGVDTTLIAALEDAEWQVVTSAAISLGIQHSSEARSPLMKLAKHGDWRYRAAGVYGLVKLRDRDALGVIVSALEDDEGLIRHIAWNHLKELSNKEHAIDDVGEWRSWFEAAGDRVRMEIPPEVLKRRKALGYSRDPSKLYEGLDVVVFDSRDGGDRIQDILGFLEIEHRMVQAGQVDEAGVHPDAIYVANCPGEIAPKDVDRLAWFVHAGGYLFGSCWSLQETIARAIPGFVQRYPTTGEVMDDVFCVSSRPSSEYLRGVIDGGVRPSYALIGAYLIDVVNPELVQVLVDSPECASRWGCGTMAAWFRVGHGVVLDSVNHFNAQGFERAQGLKKVEERWAYAIDHLGLSYEELRATKREKYWKKSNQVAKNVKDLSVLRLITNFVLDQRKRD